MNLRKRKKVLKEEVIFAEHWPYKKIFIISIRMPRLVKCLRRLGSLARYVTIVPACNGETIARKEWKDSLQTTCSLLRGQLGCFESHCRVWRHIVENKIKEALILEDDIRLRPCKALLDRIANTLLKLPPQWDMLLLGATHMCEKRQLLHTGISIPKAFHGTHAYVINSNSALKLLMHPRIRSFDAPIDVLLSQLGQSGHLSIFAFEPTVFKLTCEKSDTESIL